MLSIKLLSSTLALSLLVSCGANTRDLRSSKSFNGLSSDAEANSSEDLSEYVIFSEDQLENYFAQVGSGSNSFSAEDRLLLKNEVKKSISENSEISYAQGVLIENTIMSLFDSTTKEDYSSLSTAVSALSLLSDSTSRETNVKLFWCSKRFSNE